MPEIVIADASLSDLNDLRQLEEICFPLDRWPLLDLIGVLTLPAIVRKKVLVDGQFAGFAAGDVRKRQNRGLITTIAVFPNFRGFGVAKELLKACENEMGVVVISLNVRKSNKSARSLYTKAGYTQKEIWRNYYIGGEDGIVFEKNT